MSNFDRLPSLEAQPTTMRRQDDPEYRDDPEFTQFAQELSDKLFSLTSNISKLQQQVNLLGTKRDTERARERVHTLLEEAREGFKEVGEGIKQLSSYNNLTPYQKHTQSKLLQEFQASGVEFQAVQRQALDKQRATAAASKAALEDSERYTDEPSRGQQQTQQQEQVRLASQDEVDFQEQLIIERESEIRNIEQSVGELNSLFRDVATIVRDQGQQLDIIDENVMNTVTDTRAADGELRVADRYQRKARGKMCCLLLVGVIILLVVILAAVLG